MKRLALLLSLLLVSCDDRYRYKCQDPDNWGKPECEPPTCEADGSCTKYLIGRTPEIHSGDNSGANTCLDCGSGSVLSGIRDATSERPSSQ